MKERIFAVLVFIPNLWIWLFHFAFEGYVAAYYWIRSKT